MTKFRSLLALLPFALAAIPCSADIFRHVDAEGRVTFTDVRIDKRSVLIMKTPRPAPAPAMASADAPAAASIRPAAYRVPHAGKHYGDMIARVAREQQVDPALLHAVVTVESGYNPRARSPKGATGLMQLMPATAKRYGVTDIHDPVQNLSGGARYLRDLLGMFNNNLRLAIAAYNAGEGAVMKSGNAIPPYAETRAYVPKVLHHYERHRAAARTAS